MKNEKVEKMRDFIKIIPENLDLIKLTLLLENLDKVQKENKDYNPLFELKTLSLVYGVSVTKEDLIYYTEVILGQELSNYFNSHLRFVEDTAIQRIIKEVYNEGDLLISNKDDYCDLCKLVAEYGKARPEVITPKSLNILMSKLLDLKEDESIYDCASGNGSSLLLTANNSNTIFSQEINYDLYIQQLLMFKLFDLNTVQILNENTLIHPIFSSESVDRVISNPPFALRIMNELEIDDYITCISGELYQANREADIYFYNLISKIVRKKAVFVAPSGLSFKQTKIAVAYKKWLVDNHYLETVIQLPSGLFGPFSGVSTVLFVINKEKTNDKVYMIDISDSDFIIKNRLSVEIKENKMDELALMIQRKDEISGMSVCVSSKDIKDAEWNLTPKKYIPFKNLTEKNDVQLLLNERQEILNQLKNQNEIVNECLLKAQRLE